LIELLLVMAIMVILMGLLVSAALKIRQKTLIGRSKMDAGRLQRALEIYRDQRGFLPSQPDGEIDKDDESYENAGIVRQLRGCPESEEFFRPAASELNGKGSFKDSWGRAFRVAIWKERPTDTFTRCCRVYCCGPDRHWDGGHGGPYTDSGGRTVVGDDFSDE
jgi:type II secretory pathway pseudopilin PulG